MSILDKIVDAVTPEPSDDDRRTARAKALATAGPDDWLSLAIQHHIQLEAAFNEVQASRDTAQRQQAQQALAVLLTGHANAEESVLYPALAQAGESGHAGHAYSEQAEAKIGMAALESLAPLSREFEEKLETIRRAVAHHVYEEESHWFLQIKQKVPATKQAALTHRYQQEFNRYVHPGADHEPLSRGRPSMAAPAARPS